MVKGLPYKQRDLSFIPRTCIGTLVTPVLGRWRQAYSWSARLVCLNSGPVRACLKKNKKKKKKEAEVSYV